MGGITALDALLAGMAPLPDPVDYVFAAVDAARDKALAPRALMRFREREATTLILSAGLVGDDPALSPLPRYRRITLSVHSSLDAVGLTAAVSHALGVAGIPANVVAAYYHDHIFVPAADAARALAVLQTLSDDARRSSD